MTLDSGDLARNLELLDLSERCEIFSGALTWTEMREFVQLFTKLAKSPDAQLSLAEERALTQCRTWLRMQSDLPVWTDGVEPTTADLIESLERAIGVDSRYVDQFRRLKELLEIMTAQPHPASSFLLDWLSGEQIIDFPEGHRNFGTPAIALVVRYESNVLAVQNWIDTENLFAQVVTYAQLKHADPFQTLVLFGPPSRYESSFWSRKPDSDFRGQWLLTAPPARKVIVLSWASHSRLDQALLGPWEGAKTPVIEELEGLDEPEEVITPDFLNIVPKVQTSQFTFEHDEQHSLVQGKKFQLMGDDQGVWVVYKESFHPKPRVLSADFSRIFLHGAPEALTVGTHLVFRATAAEREELLNTSRIWWCSKYPENAFEQAEALREQLKKDVGSFLTEYGVEEFKSRCRSAGLEKDYVRQLHDRIRSTEYVAPREQENYLAINRAVEHEAPRNAFQLLSQLRTARQQAGNIILNNLLEKLQRFASEGKLESLREYGSTELIDEHLGMLFLTTVVRVESERETLPSSRLGHPLNSKGELWLS